jgi:16S rRNA (adenine1518-N6/adenine1519-N6)-dimethyltransferase
MQTLTQIKALLADRGLRPKHALGQNYLHDHNQLKKLVAAAEVQHGDLVLEVGPGTGTLTETLLAAGARVVACELDRDMVSIVQDRNSARVRASAAELAPGELCLVQGDCLDGKHTVSARVLAALGPGQPFRVVANLPYQAATPLMATLLESHPECTGQYVTIQREVADRLTAAPGGKEYGPLSVTMQLLAQIQLIGVVPPGSFWPAPKVTSAMIAIRPRLQRPVSPWPPFAAFVQKAFGQRRKQIGSTLGRDVVSRGGLDPQRRPESLRPQEWVDLYLRSYTMRNVLPGGTNSTNDM